MMFDVPGCSSSGSASSRRRRASAAAGEERGTYFTWVEKIKKNFQSAAEGRANARNPGYTMTSSYICPFIYALFLLGRRNIVLIVVIDHRRSPIDRLSIDVMGDCQSTIDGNSIHRSTCTQCAAPPLQQHTKNSVRQK